LLFYFSAEVAVAKSFDRYQMPDEFSIDGRGVPLSCEIAAANVHDAQIVKADKLVDVTRWGRPGLESGDWVMTGGKTLSNWLKSGKWQPGLGNEFADFSSGTTSQVVKSSLKFPHESGILVDTINYVLGQRIYKP
jgi:hypothetical protein